MTTIETRKIRAEEIDAYRRIGGYAYGVWTDEYDDEWIPEPEELDERLAVYADGVMTAMLTNHSYEQVVRGVWRSASAIGGVATLPEYRRKGHVRKLMDATFADMRDKGHVVSVLYPFHQGFYAKFGYVRTNPIPRVWLESSALSHLIPLADQAGNGWRYERLRAKDGIDEYKAFLDQLAQHPRRSDYNGYMRDPKLDGDDLPNEHMVLVKQTEGNSGEEQIVAAALYKIEKYGDPQGATRVNDCHWIDASARDRLLAFIALHGAGFPKIRMAIPPNINFHSWLSDSTESYDANMSHLPIMVRVMDVAEVLSAIRVRSIAPQSSLTFAVIDEICPWVGGTFILTENDGVLSAQRVDESTTLTMTIDGLTALVYGTLSVSEIIYRGWVTGASETEIGLMEEWFPEQSVFNLLGF